MQFVWDGNYKYTIYELYHCKYVNFSEKNKSYLKNFVLKALVNIVWIVYVLSTELVNPENVTTNIWLIIILCVRLVTKFP